jgi:hypothetical protein
VGKVHYPNPPRFPLHALSAFVFVKFKLTGTPFSTVPVERPSFLLIRSFLGFKNSSHAERNPIPLSARPSNIGFRNSLDSVNSLARLWVAVFLAGLPTFPAFAYHAQEIMSASEQSAGTFGYAVSGVPDTNGDGRGDVVVGALFESAGAGFGSAGRAYLFDGATGAVLHEFESPNKQENGGFGVSVSGVPDANGDGRGDVIVGAQFENPNGSPDSAGRAYLFDGNTGALLHEFMSPNEELFSFFGYSVGGVGDTNGDGRGDVVVGAPSDDPGASPANAGRAYIFDGSTGTPLRELISLNEEAEGQFGISVAGVPDANGDGRGDVIVGAQMEDPGSSPEDAGRAYLFNGDTGVLLWELASPNEDFDGFFGKSVGGAPDVNGDGRGDVAVGAEQENPGSSPSNAGRAYVFDGATGGLLHELMSPNEEPFGFFGMSVSGVPDVNADGRGDFIVGANREEPEGSPNDVGRAYVFDGATGAILGAYLSPNAEEFGQFGRAVSGVPDTDGDGRGDVVVGAENEDPGASPNEGGRAYIIASLPPEIGVAPSSLAFGTQNVDSGPTAAMSVTIENTGCLALEFTGAGVALTGPDALEFAFAISPSTGNLISDVTREIFVAFDPSSGGAKAANLTITSNDSDEPTVHIPLSGTGLEDSPTPTFTQTQTNTATPTATVTPSVTSSETPTSTLTDTPTEAPHPTPTDSATVGPSPTPTDTPTEGASPTPTDTPTEGASPTPSETPTVNPSESPTPTNTSGPSPTPTETPTPGGVADYDVAPEQTDGVVNEQDLLEWLRRIREEGALGSLLLDFARFWKSDGN